MPVTLVARPALRFTADSCSTLMLWAMLWALGSDVTISTRSKVDLIGIGPGAGGSSRYP